MTAQRCYIPFSLRTIHKIRQGYRVISAGLKWIRVCIVQIVGNPDCPFYFPFRIPIIIHKRREVLSKKAPYKKEPFTRLPLFVYFLDMYHTFLNFPGVDVYK